MSHVPGRSDYRSTTAAGAQPVSSGNESMMDQANEAVAALADRAREFGERAGEMATDAVETAKERPYTAALVVGGLAFAVGALWMMRRQPRASHMDALLAQLPDRNSVNAMLAQLPARWRP